MQGNLLTTVLALLFYLASSVMGGSSNSKAPTAPPDSSHGAYFPFYGKVSGKQAQLRPEIDSTTGIVVVSQGTGLMILDQKNGWYSVQTDSGAQGWIPTWMVSVRKSIPGNNQDKVIAGYYVENNSRDQAGYRALEQNLNIINTVIPFSYKVDQYGTIIGSHYSRPFSLARSAGLTTLAIVNNINGSNFNSNSIHKMLTNNGARSKAINGILRVIMENGYQGVNIDFENVPSRDRMYVTAFFRELGAALHSRNLLVTASLPAKTSNDTTSSHGGAFDYQALGPLLDQAMLMTYDEHFANGSPGPVASYPWVERVIKYALRSFPPEKIIIGIAAYGYDWRWGSGKALTYYAIQNLIDSHKIIPKWDNLNRVPYFTYRSWGISHEVWYENRYSTVAKMELIRKYGLKGVAVWRLGYEDPTIWTAIRQQLR
ncbi:MAG TPA: glycosyl hydrolase family 18 protein [Bacillota bacterium]|nr:glycosyl hydrolase family 18 protein [Bacillota bacterium]